MGIWIKIRKLKADANDGYYVVYKQDYTSADYYMRIDKKNRFIHFYLTNDFTHSVKTIDLNNTTDPIGELPGKSMLGYSRAIIQGMKACDNDNFPDIIDHCA